MIRLLFGPETEKTFERYGEVTCAGEKHFANQDIAFFQRAKNLFINVMLNV